MPNPTQRATNLRATQTGAEARLWRVLRNRQLNGRKFRRQWPIDRYVVDFACIEAKRVVEVVGATHGSQAAIASDAVRTEWLGRCGFEVVRIANAEIDENLDGVRGTILAAIERRDVL
ncbi:DUF559 domain-containing protein [Methylobacterium sp. E-025]|uniref:endonuclease domain-containing protein n=1 Tax=unclassified Methylobacterium TaxID=2615210 RepID=UPI001FBB578D|nr:MULTISPECIES: DUF559 domain-containing protein [unclassified Methylobacterium]MCJ2008540.1 DUF559 domain-containing protein [Methylobacterium sp. J-092]MCJ2113041.1 DUF559 domain-containing protein [Methylobacterium sp. E-025]